MVAWPLGVHPQNGTHSKTTFNSGKEKELKEGAYPSRTWGWGLHGQGDVWGRGSVFMSGAENPNKIMWGSKMMLDTRLPTYPSDQRTLLTKIAFEEFNLRAILIFFRILEGKELGHSDLEVSKFYTNQSSELNFPSFLGKRRPEFRRKRDVYEPLLTAMAQALPSLSVTPWKMVFRKIHPEMLELAIREGVILAIASCQRLLLWSRRDILSLLGDWFFIHLPALEVPWNPDLLK